MTTAKNYRWLLGLHIAVAVVFVPVVLWGAFSRQGLITLQREQAFAFFVVLLNSQVDLLALWFVLGTKHFDRRCAAFTYAAAVWAWGTSLILGYNSLMLVAPMFVFGIMWMLKWQLHTLPDPAVMTVRPFRFSIWTCMAVVTVFGLLFAIGMTSRFVSFWLSNGALIGLCVWAALRPHDPVIPSCLVLGATLTTAFLFAVEISFSGQMRSNGFFQLALFLAAKVFEIMVVLGTLLILRRYGIRLLSAAEITSSGTVTVGTQHAIESIQAGV